MSQSRTVLVFGPQALSFQEESLDGLRSAILGNPSNTWMRAAVAGLPQYAKLFTTSISTLNSSPAIGLLETFSEWLNSDAPFPSQPKIPNTLLTPIVVLHQLAQYTQYVESIQNEKAHQADHWNASETKYETLGFCSGLLSALVVSSSSNEAEFQLYGAVALRLAALIGALVDAEDVGGPNGPSKSFSLAWSQPELKQKLDKILADEADAYISVQYDNNRATITTTAGSFEALQQRLQSVGTIAAEIPLVGRFHCSCYEDDIEDVLSLCDATPGLQLPDADQLQLPSYSTTDSKLIQSGKLHHIALRGILLDTCHWWQTFESMLGKSVDSQVPPMVLFGLEKCVPPSMLRHVNDQITYMPALKLQDPSISSLATPRHHHEDEIVVVGMACKVAGADDVDELWDIMCKGESQHVEVPEDRFTFDTHWRDKDNKRKWYGNFVRDHDAFDHK